MKIRTGDTVKILSGKDRGRSGKVLTMLPRESRVLVEGINLRKKHRRSRRQDKKGEIILIPAPVPLGVVALMCPSCGKATRIGLTRDENGKKLRVCKKCGNTLSS